MPSYIYRGGASWSEVAATDLPASGVTAGTYGDAAHVGAVTVNAEGIVTAASNIAIAGGGGGPTELSYTARTTPLSVTAVTEGTAQTVITAPAQTFNGTTTVQLQFFAPSVSVLANNNIFGEFFDGATPLGWQMVIGNAAANPSNYSIGLISLELTPTAATHTYSFRCYTASGGTQTIEAGLGGSGAYSNAFLRIVTVV